MKIEKEMVFKRIGQALARKRKRERKIILEDFIFFSHLV